MSQFVTDTRTDSSRELQFISKAAIPCGAQNTGLLNNFGGEADSNGKGPVKKAAQKALKSHARVPKSAAFNPPLRNRTRPIANFYYGSSPGRQPRETQTRLATDKPRDSFGPRTEAKFGSAAQTIQIAKAALRRPKAVVLAAEDRQRAGQEGRAESPLDGDENQITGQ